MGSKRQFYGNLWEDFHCYSLDGRRWRFSKLDRFLEIVDNKILKEFTVRNISRIIGKKYYAQD